MRHCFHVPFRNFNLKKLQRLCNFAKSSRGDREAIERPLRKQRDNSKDNGKNGEERKGK